ncbi:Bacterial mobilization protein (MobC) [Desulfitobacterium dehalogenans ATCC 51507]|uniref:Bacterial mobilization protein (MobC) n=1 Tax=Desulfitobacterium dehalogenans (strain ATCC 51507 / DSM 9161 / JW/IU-DC1) TaxID=756499 RepID=I4ABZ1_DESDJ|nr:MobC family plasmid mobilization relaxosome protein [Desulfitobacterium dehalogenans]AFM01476.1 Bacterial mobilization protein (MobC) [Desulfitobacterium dehalogenans ATCC 51507]
MRKNPERIVIRTTAERKKDVQDKAKRLNMDVNDYMLMMEERGIIYVVEDVPNLLRQLGGMGNNLNQLTHLCHMGKIKEPEILKQLEANMKGVKKILRSLSLLIARTKK